MELKGGIHESFQVAGSCNVALPCSAHEVIFRAAVSLHSYIMAEDSSIDRSDSLFSSLGSVIDEHANEHTLGPLRANSQWQQHKIMNDDLLREDPARALGILCECFDEIADLSSSRRLAEPLRARPQGLTRRSQIRFGCLGRACLSS